MSRYLVKKFSGAEWAQVSEAAHAAAFGELRPPAIDRIDFALLCVEARTDTPVGYVTASEVNAFILNWKFGGAFPPLRGKASLLAAYRELIGESAKGTWNYIITLVKNDNLPSLRVAMALGFKIIGVQAFEDEILVELCLKLEKGT